MRRTVLSAAAATSLVLAALAAPAAQASIAPDTGTRAASATFEKEVLGTRVRGAAGKLRSTSNIVYHNGPIMDASTTNVYVVWYGDWSNHNSGAQPILNTFLGSIGGSPYFNINTLYTNSAGSRVKNSVTLAGSTTDPYSQGSTLSDAGVQAVVSKAISSGALPKDPTALYFVLTSYDVAESSGFLTKYCGWHTHSVISGTDIKYSFVGDPTNGMSACAAQTTSPNGNAPADAMVSVMAHELEETVTDPDLNAWYDRQGAENGDKCAWNFGATSTLTSGAKYNMTLGSAKYLIQQNWKAGSSQGCALQYP